MKAVFEDLTRAEIEEEWDNPAYAKLPMIARPTGRGTFHLFIGTDSSSYHSSAELNQQAIHLAKQKAQHVTVPKKPVHNHQPKKGK